MGEKSLSLSQKLALLPASIPDCVLDFLEDFKNDIPFAEPSTIESIKPSYWDKNKVSLKESVQNLRKLGKIESVDGEILARQYPGACICRLQFSNGEDRGIGFIVSQGTGKTGTISIVHFHDGAHDHEAIKEQLIKHYREPTKG